MTIVRIAFTIPDMKVHLGASLLLALFLWGCQPAAGPAAPKPSITVQWDSQTTTFTTARTTVRDVLQDLGIQLGPLDRVAPGEVAVLSDGMLVKVTRVVEALETDTLELPFEKQVVRNEGLAAGESRLLQTGVNGSEEITWRVVLEDGSLASRAVLRRAVLVAPVPEIVMVSAQTNFTVIPIEGTLAYISAGNAWLVRTDSGQRRPLTTSGDLDGRVFQLAPDAQRILYTRRLTDADAFNALWTLSTAEAAAAPLDLKVRNVLWAGWSPQAGSTLAYSSAEPRSAAPGWQANNDLYLLTLPAPGKKLAEPQLLLAASSGGVYGWYGRRYAWAPDARRIAYAAADSIGVLDVADPLAVTQQVLAQFPAYQTYSDWAWVPEPDWSLDGNFLYAALHAAPVGLERPEDSPAFDVAALAVDGSLSVTLVAQAGMWAAPVLGPPGNPARPVAFLQAINALQSVNSGYRLMLMDRDGSNRSALYPAAGETGLLPQLPAWSPAGSMLAFIDGGDLWVIEIKSGVAQQLTGDGQTSSPTWMP